MGTHYGSRPTGNTAGTYDSRFPPGVGIYAAISNPTLQWIMSAQSGSNLVANTSQDLSDGVATTYTGNWVSTYASTRTSYTNHAGTTRYYYPLTASSDLKTVSNTSDATSIISNGGFTFWINFIPYNSSTSWSRIFNYFQLANGSSGSGISTTSQYHGPLLYYHRGNARFEYRRPSDTSSNSGAGTIYNITAGTGVSMSVLIRQTDVPATTIWVIRNGVALHTGAAVSISASPAYGIKNVQNNAIPVFADSIYSAVAFNGIMEGGFANRPYTDGECLTLVQALDNKYKY